MQTFTGKQYVMIDIANQMGYDKRTWQDRINWAETNESRLEEFTEQADNKYLYIKAVNALRDAQNGVPTGYIMGLDATASGLQIMAAMAGCPITARAVNLINTGKREDVYLEVGTEMGVARNIIKDPTMTVFYGSRAEPEKVFGEATPELKAFYDALTVKLPGAMSMLRIVQRHWNPEALNYSWDLPDGHNVNMLITGLVDKKLEIDELDHRVFTYRAKINMAQERGQSLAANVVHSVDGYIAREVVRRCYAEGVQVATIHDSFWTYPGDMNTVRKHYIALLAEIADLNLLESILRQISGNPGYGITKDSEDLSTYIRDSEYPLS